MGNACGKVENPYIPIKNTENKEQSIARGFDKPQYNTVPEDMMYCRNGNGVYELKTNKIITGYAIKNNERWLFFIDKVIREFLQGGDKHLVFDTLPKLMIKHSEEGNYHYIIASTETEKAFINNINVINGYTNNNLTQQNEIKGNQLNNYIAKGATIYFHKTLYNAMAYTNVHGNELVKFNDGWDALKVTINGMEMYAYAMPPIISGGYKKKKTSTKTKTQAKHTFIHGKKSYTRVIHLGKRGGKYVMLNGELVPISKLQKAV